MDTQRLLLYGDGKLYYSYNAYNKLRYGCRVYKLTFDIGATCPNRDGSKGFGGCIFCSEYGSGDHAVRGIDFDNAIALLGDKACGKYIAYFQGFTATYMSVDLLKNYIDIALSRDDVVGISLATRADCIAPQMLDYLKELSSVTDLTIELGLQTINDSVAERHNRRHTYSEFIDCYTQLKNNGIRICIHIINGLIGETREDMINTAKEIAHLHPGGIKIHCLHVLKNTKLAEYYELGIFIPLTLEEYVDIVADQLSYLPTDTVIERLTGDGDRGQLIAPLWTLSKRITLNNIDKRLRSRNIIQGDRYEKHN